MHGSRGAHECRDRAAAERAFSLALCRADARHAVTFGIKPPSTPAPELVNRTIDEIKSLAEGLRQNEYLVLLYGSWDLMIPVFNQIYTTYDLQYEERLRFSKGQFKILAEAFVNCVNRVSVNHRPCINTVDQFGEKIKTTWPDVLKDDKPHERVGRLYRLLSTMYSRHYVLGDRVNDSNREALAAWLQGKVDDIFGR